MEALFETNIHDPSYVKKGYIVVATTSTAAVVVTLDYGVTIYLGTFLLCHHTLWLPRNR